MDNGQYHTSDLRQVASVCRGIVVFFVAMAALCVLVSMINKGNPGSLGDILTMLGGVTIGIVGAGVIYLHLSNNMVRISESGIERTGLSDVKWQDINKITVTKRINARSQRVDTIICIFYGSDGLFKISSSPEETAQILLLLKQYAGERLTFNEKSA